MALVHDNQGDYSETLESFGRVLAGLEKLLGKDHPSLTTVNMASVYDVQGDYSKVFEWYGRALADRERSLGKEHPSTNISTISSWSIAKVKTKTRKPLFLARIATGALAGIIQSFMCIICSLEPNLQLTTETGLLLESSS
jgi:hypothetical protein